jgi:putative transposase
MTEHRFSERQACKLLEIDRSSYRYEPKPDKNGPLRQELVTLAKRHPRYGYRMLASKLKSGGWVANHKRIERLYRQEHLMMRRLKRKRLTRAPQPMTDVDRANQEWSMDFVADGLATGRAIRALTVIDSYTRECPAIEVDFSLTSRRVTRVLERIIEQRGEPERIRVDNGPEFTSRHFLSWCEQRGIGVTHIQPGKPMQNGRVESFNGRFRHECLNANWFVTLQDAKQKIEAWRCEYNQERPHSSLGYVAPAVFAARGPFAATTIATAGARRVQAQDELAALGLDTPPRRQAMTSMAAKGQIEVLC